MTWKYSIYKLCYFYELLFSLVSLSLCLNVYIPEIILWILKEITFILIFLEWIRRLFLQSSRCAVNNMDKSSCAHKQGHFNDGVMSGRESMWVVYFKFAIVCKHSLQSFMGSSIFVRVWTVKTLRPTSITSWKMEVFRSEGPIWPTLEQLDTLESKLWMKQTLVALHTACRQHLRVFV